MTKNRDGCPGCDEIVAVTCGSDCDRHINLDLSRETVMNKNDIITALVNRKLSTGAGRELCFHTASRNLCFAAAGRTLCFVAAESRPASKVAK